jgi:prepilin-type N-terminal cleavage/methylation domain-containing protein
MKISSRSEGFTIIETLIVLAVSGGLLLIAVLYIGGKQAKTQFTTGARDLQSRYQQVIDDVANGYYPNNGSIQCHNVGGVPQVSNGGAALGTNQDCILLGKVIQFNSGGASPEIFKAYSVVGVRKNGSGDLVQNIGQAKPRLININSQLSTETMPYGMTTQFVKFNGTSIGSVGFISSIGYIDSAGVAQGPAQQVDVYPIPGTTLGDGGTSAIETGLPVTGANVNPANGVQVCVKGAAPNQWVLYTIGGQGRQVSVAMTFKAGANCT